jgi:energy-converting hydrogenase Eha subunit F
MEKLGIFFAVLIIIITLFFTTSVKSPQPEIPQPIPESKLSTIEPSEMALQLSDVPAGFSILERTERTRSNTTQSELDLGWIKGYYVVYKRINSDKQDAETIQQLINVYPFENVNHVQAYIKKFALSSANENVQVDELSDPKIGDSSQAFRIRNLNNQMTIYIISFTKNDVVELILAGVTSADYESIKNITKTAAEKIK